MQKLGQHFLKNDAVLAKIVDAIAPADGDRIIEIGPGHGELTIPLARATGGTRAEIFCIEKDHALVGSLESLAAASGHINVVEGDALKLLPSLISKDCKIVGNIPYYITGKLLRIISELEQKPERAIFLIQKEVAERICAAAPQMNRLAASVQFWATPAIIAVVPRKDFSPPPDVESAVIALARNPASAAAIDPTLYYRAVRTIFAQPRKTILNNLSAMGGAQNKEHIAGLLLKIGVPPDSRPQNLNIRQIIAIASDPLWG
jgi:16S rRNA (adenine1518-N6/adenine1519-N6)-dimethyltransferase